MYEASPLDKKQLFDMKDYFTQNRFKFLGWAAILVIGITLGFMARPGFDKFALGYADKPYVAPKSDVEVAVDEYFASSQYQAEVRAEAEGRVKLKMAIELNKEAKMAAEKSSQYEMRALNGISGDTATATIALETKAGRR